MSHWNRTARLDAADTRQIETWTLTAEDGARRNFEIDVKTGKPLDVMSLKNSSLADTREYADMLAARAQALRLRPAAGGNDLVYLLRQAADGCGGVPANL